MKIYTVKIDGKTPLLLHKFTDAAALQATSGSAAVMVGSRGTPREQAEASLYYGINGDLIVPSPNLFSCLMEAGRYFKHGKSKVTTLKTSILPACVELEGLQNGIELPIESVDGWDVDSRAVRMPSTGGRILRHRPSFNDWSLRFSLKVDIAMIDPKMLREILDSAGNQVGLGDFRPACKGPFGRFVVTEWTETKE